MWTALGKLAHDTKAAVAPTIALSLFALIAAGGIAFDYARLAAMDTELQDAADQAALAAATQLDGEAGARARAISAAQDLIQNLTLFANDNGTPDVTVPTIIFYSGYDPVTGVKSPVATGDADADYVLVTVGGRTANYALTPIVAAMSSGVTTASAFATMDSAYCNLPPFMMCKPAGGFDPAAHIGHGMRLVIGSPTAPGNFGFLQTGFGTGAEALAKAIGYNGSAGGCVAARGAITEPGDKNSVRAAFNSRFDMSDSGQLCPAGGTCSPSTNVRKDLVRGNNCSSSGNQGWSELADVDRYRAPNTTPLSAANPMNGTNIYPKTMGHPRDLCHAVSESGSCAGGMIGNGNWDRDAFFNVNYGWTSQAIWTANTGLPANVTRYQVYLWEAAHPSLGLANNSTTWQVPNGQGGGGGGTQKHTNSQPVCRPPGIAPGNLDTDRRVMAAAVIDCTGLHGRDVVQPSDWVDVFLVEPAFPRTGRTDDGDIYVEIIGTRPLPGINQTIGNVMRRDVPRLIE